MGTPSCSRPHPATDNGVRDCGSNWLVAPPSLMAVPPEPLVHSINCCSSATAVIRSCNLPHARHPPSLCGQSWYSGRIRNSQGLQCLAGPIFDGVGLSGFKSMANDFFTCQSWSIDFCLLLFFPFPSFWSWGVAEWSWGLWPQLCGVGDLWLIGCKSLSGSLALPTMF